MKATTNKASRTPKTHRLHFVVDDDLYEQIQKMAEVDQRSVCSLVRVAVLKYLKEKSD